MKRKKQELEVQERQLSQAQEVQQAQFPLMQQQNNAMLELKQEEERKIERNKETFCYILYTNTCTLKYL